MKRVQTVEVSLSRHNIQFVLQKNPSVFRFGNGLFGPDPHKKKSGSDTALKDKGLNEHFFHAKNLI